MLSKTIEKMSYNTYTEVDTAFEEVSEQNVSLVMSQKGLEQLSSAHIAILFECMSIQYLVKEFSIISFQ